MLQQLPTMLQEFLLPVFIVVIFLSRLPMLPVHSTKAYEGIVYAADMGCQITNCSWGGGGGSFGQNIIDYATFNKNSLVIAAAGNNGNTLYFILPPLTMY
ncbi:MAG: S8 family serine peptidase [Bacteroidetes bacterium]|nr:S8 family serine peptidase [Bacteroidota bacterium]